MFAGLASNPLLVESFNIGMMASSLVLSVILVVYSFKNQSWPRFGFRALATATAGYVLAQTGFVVSLTLGDASPVLTGCLGAVSGACFIAISLAWIALFSMDFRNVMFYGALICAASSLLTWILSLCPPLIVVITVPLLVLIGAGTPAFLEKAGKHHRHDARRDFSQSPSPDSLQDSSQNCLQGLSKPPETLDSTQVNGFMGSLRNLLSVIWLPFIGFLVCVFIVNVLELRVGDLINTESISALLAAVLVVVLTLVRRKTSLVILVDKLIIPACVAVSLVLHSFPEESPLFVIGAASILAPLLFLSIFTLSSLVVMARAGEFPLPFIFGATFFMVNMVSLLGTAFAVALASSEVNVGTLLWVLICLYFAVVIGNLGYSSWHRDVHVRDPQYTGEDNAKDAQLLGALQRRHMEELAQEHGLTSREREIFEYMSRGHGSAFIARNLFISTNTARTHIRNIYRKLGVRSREELLMAIDGKGAAKNK
jgi:DNA-binding CsgD family transcriptional regulator